MTSNGFEYGHLKSYPSDEINQMATSDKTQLVDENGTKADAETLSLQEVVYIREKICGFDGLMFIIVSSLIFAVLITIGMVISIILGPPQIQPYGAVSSDAEVCSKIGVSILQRGGSAVDGGIATMLCLGVVHGHASGLGGGGFMIIGNPKDQSNAAINFREMSPASTREEMFAQYPNAAYTGGMSIAIPGEIAGFRLAWEQFGILPWRDLFQSAKTLAFEGFAVTEALAAAVENIDLSELSRPLQKLYAPNGTKVKAGDKIKRAGYGGVLQQLSHLSDSTSSEENIRTDVIELVNSHGGNVSNADFKSYRAKLTPVLTMKFRDHDLLTVEAPSSGPLVVLLMNIMEDYNYTRSNSSDDLFYHRFIEATKFAEAYATGLGDPNVTKSVRNYTLDMISKSNAERLYKKIKDGSTLKRKDYFSERKIHTPLASYGGAQVSVMASGGSVLSISSSLNSPFGSKLMTNNGVIMNNAMANFDWQGKTGHSPSPANLLAPSKQPQSDLAPLLSWNVSNLCTRRFTIGGASGIGTYKDGGRIGAGVAQVALQLLMGYNLSTAIGSKNRVFDPLIPNRVEYESGITNSTIELFQRLNETLELEPIGISIVHGVMKEKDQIYAYSDKRRLGSGSKKFGRP